MKGGWRLLISRISVVVFAAAMLVGLYADGRYLLGAPIAGIIQIICGPRAYRWIGALVVSGVIGVIVSLALRPIY